MPKDFFSDDLSKVSFVRDALEAFFEYVGDERVSKALKARVAKLKRMLEEEYGFRGDATLEERLAEKLVLKEECGRGKREVDEDLPTIVDEGEAFISFE